MKNINMINNKFGTRVFSLNNKLWPNSKRSQVTMFIIIALVIVGALVLFFLFRNKINIDISGKSGDVLTNPESYMQSCVEPKVKEAVSLIMKQGGYTDPVLFRNYENERVAYLCYQEQYYLSCVNQEAMLIEHLKDEIHSYIKKDTENCFADLQKAVESKGGTFTSKGMEFKVELEPKKIIISMDDGITIEKSGESSKFKNFKSITGSPLYDIAIVVQEINNQEARYCNFEQNGFMMLYPQFNIDKFRTGEGAVVYTVKDRESGKSFRFAVRSCVIPPAVQ